MDDALKARLIGATVLVLLAVLLIPELLSGRKVSAPASAQDAAARGTRTFTIELAGGEVLFEQGTMGDSIYIVSRGEIELVRELETGEAQVRRMADGGQERVALKDLVVLLAARAKNL